MPPHSCVAVYLYTGILVSLQAPSLANRPNTARTKNALHSHPHLRGAQELLFGRVLLLMVKFARLMRSENAGSDGVCFAGLEIMHSVWSLTPYAALLPLCAVIVAHSAAGSVEV
jgi:hypothetical protein